MIRTLTLACTCLLLLAVTGCTSGIRVQSDWDEEAEFDQFTSFKVLQETGVADALVARRLSDGVRNHLTARNFTEDIENPDFLVAIHANVVDRVDVHSWGYSASSRHWHSGSNITVTNYQEGTLIIDFVDSSNNELFWRGWGTRNVTSSTREAQALQDAVDAILAKYPPK